LSHVVVCQAKEVERRGILGQVSNASEKNRLVRLFSAEREWARQRMAELQAA
jgi:hypothetical protein